jgi:biopolymer transport protein ExbB/TolQ
MNRLAVAADQAGETYPLLLGGMVEWLMAIIVLLVVAGVATLAVVLLNRHRSAKHEDELHRDLQEQRQDIERREHRLTEREERLDLELRHLEERSQQLADSRHAETS